jgi:hypothetical protein
MDQALDTPPIIPRHKPKTVPINVKHKVSAIPEANTSPYSEIAEKLN